MTQMVTEPAQDAGRGTLGAQIARQIEQDIRREGWREGHLIGSEAELTARFEVGVAAVREASRILEARGLARVRRGPGGGLFVTAPERASVTEPPGVTSSTSEWSVASCSRCGWRSNSSRSRR